jgi:ribonuclease HI
MKQLSFLEEKAPEKKITKVAAWHLYVDGAARNNPGPAGAGIALFNAGKAVLKKGFYLGPKTNNQAEYLALLLGLFLAQQKIKEGEHLAICADSQLLVRQIIGQYKVKDAQLKKLQAVAFKLLMHFDYTINHVMRSENEVADEMANVGIDKKIKVPDEFITLLRAHELSL